MIPNELGNEENERNQGWREAEAEYEDFFLLNNEIETACQLLAVGKNHTDRKVMTQQRENGLLQR